MCDDLRNWENCAIIEVPGQCSDNMTICAATVGFFTTMLHRNGICLTQQEFFPHCLARETLPVPVNEDLCPDPAQRHAAEAEGLIDMLTGNNYQLKIIIVCIYIYIIHYNA